MTSRLNPLSVQTNLVQSFIDFSNQVLAAGLEKSLVELVKIRASQINGWNRLGVGYRRTNADAVPAKSA